MVSTFGDCVEETTEKFVKALRGKATPEMKTLLGVIAYEIESLRAQVQSDRFDAPTLEASGMVGGGTGKLFSDAVNSIGLRENVEAEYVQGTVPQLDEEDAQLWHDRAIRAEKRCDGMDTSYGALYRAVQRWRRERAPLGMSQAEHEMVRCLEEIERWRAS